MKKGTSVPKMFWHCKCFAFVKGRISLNLQEIKTAILLNISCMVIKGQVVFKESSYTI